MCMAKNLFNFGDEVLYNDKKYILSNDIKIDSKKKVISSRRIFARYILNNGKQEVMGTLLKIPIKNIKKKKFPLEFDDRAKLKRTSYNSITRKEVKDINRFANNTKFEDFIKNFKVEPITLGGKKNYDVFWISGRWVNLIPGTTKKIVLKKIYNSFRK